METINITNIFDKLEDKNKLDRVEKILMDFRVKATLDWVDYRAGNKKEFYKENYKDVQACAKDIMEVINDKK